MLTQICRAPRSISLTVFNSILIRTHNIQTVFIVIGYIYRIKERINACLASFYFFSIVFSVVVNLSWLQMPRIIISEIMLSHIRAALAQTTTTTTTANGAQYQETKPKSYKQFTIIRFSPIPLHIVCVVVVFVLFARQAKATLV